MQCRCARVIATGSVEHRIVNPSTLFCFFAAVGPRPTGVRVSDGAPYGFSRSCKRFQPIARAMPVARQPWKGMGVTAVVGSAISSTRRPTMRSASSLPIMVDIATPRPLYPIVQVRYVVGGQRHVARPAELDTRFAQDGKR